MGEGKKNMKMSISTNIHIYDVDPGEIRSEYLYKDGDVVTVHIGYDVCLFFRDLKEYDKFVDRLVVSRDGLIRLKAKESSK